MTERSLRVLGVICLVSLAVNVFAVGMMTSHWLGPNSHPPMQPPGDHMAPPFRPLGKGGGPPWPVELPGRFMQALDESQRARIQAIRDRYSERMDSAIRRRLAQQATVVALMTQPTIDRPALQEAFAQVRALDDETAQIAQSMVLEIAEALSPEARIRLAGLLRRPMLRFQHLQDLLLPSDSRPRMPGDPEAPPGLGRPEHPDR